MSRQYVEQRARNHEGVTAKHLVAPLSCQRNFKTQFLHHAVQLELSQHIRSDDWLVEMPHGSLEQINQLFPVAPSWNASSGLLRQRPLGQTPLPVCRDRRTSRRRLAACLPPASSVPQRRTPQSSYPNLRITRLRRERLIAGSAARRGEADLGVVRCFGCHPPFQTCSVRSTRQASDP